MPSVDTFQEVSAFNQSINQSIKVFANCTYLTKCKLYVRKMITQNSLKQIMIESG